VVSATLVAQREEEESGPARPDTDQDKEEHDSGSNPKDTARKKVVQRPVYFVSSLLQGARSRYSGVQKLIFGLVMVSRKLCHYFQAHEITVVTRFPLQRILRNPEATGRIVEWALELSSFGLKFESTSTIQSRALAEFITEWMPTPDEEVQETVIPGKEAPQEWIMYFDGAFSLQGAGAVVLLMTPTGEHLRYVVQMHFPREEATNNIAEYEGLLAGLRIATELGIKKLIIRGDSQLVVRQVNKDYQNPLMEAYVEEVRRLEERFNRLQTEHVPRAENSITDHLSKCAAQKLPVEPGTFVLHLTQPFVSPTTMAQKRRKLDSGKPLPVEPFGAPHRDPARNNSPSIAGLHPPAGPLVPADEGCAPTNEEVPLVLVAEPQAPTWARHIVHFLQTGELPEGQEEA
jgi:ribonuclease HI